MRLDEIENIEAVLFDLGGTLVDTEKYYQKDWARALEHFPGTKLEIKNIKRKLENSR